MKQLDCLLINPPIKYKEEGNMWKEVDSNFPPLALAELAGFIRTKTKYKKSYTVKIIDCLVECPSMKSFVKFMFNNYSGEYEYIKFIGITTMTCNIKKAYKIAEICKKYFPDTIIVFGGVHSTYMAKEVIKNKFVDVVIRGEGEIALQKLLDGEISPKGIINPLERIKDINILPIPAYDLLPIKSYKPAKGTYKRLPAMSMVTSRGCPGKCTFCSKTVGDRITFKSACKVFREIMYLKENFGIKQINFYDDTFTMYRERIVRLCKLLMHKKAKISWTCFSRVDFVDLELLQLMKKAGCHQIMYGVESIDETILKNINKNINIMKVFEATKNTMKVGIECRLAFMIGNPGETEETIKKNIAFIKKLNPDLIVVNITTPFPGTKMFEWADKKGFILTYDWDKYDLAQQVMILENLSDEKIRYYYKKMYKDFYFRFSYIIRRLFRMRSLRDVSNTLSGAKALVRFTRGRR